MPDLLLRGGRPWGVGAPADVLIREGVIERIGPDLRADPAAEVVEVPGRLLLPGLIDAHCHVDKTLFGVAGYRTRQDRRWRIASPRSAVGVASWGCRTSST
jgi:cytosine/adenosine deaminase-related metal-dependent hydrolase